MGRITWIDAAKGYAITLVVFGHVLGGAMARNWLSGSDGDAGKLIYDYIYSFHMPLFFIISGALGIKTILEDPAGAMLSRIGTIAWPYVFWGMISILIMPIISQFTLNPAREPNFYEALTKGLSALLSGQSSWFLWTLFLTQCVLITVLQLTRISIVFALSVITFLVLAGMDLGGFSEVVRFMPFLALGALIGRRIDLIKCRSKSSSIAVGALLFVVLFAVVSLRLNENPTSFLLCGTVGSVASFMIVQSMAISLNRLMASCGVASLAIFLLHPYFQGAAREVVLRTIGTSIWWQLSIPTMAGVIGPIFIMLCAERLGLHWIFRLRLNSLMSRGERRTPMHLSDPS